MMSLDFSGDERRQARRPERVRASAPPSREGKPLRLKSPPRQRQRWPAQFGGVQIGGVPVPLGERALESAAACPAVAAQGAGDLLRDAGQALRHLVGDLLVVLRSDIDVEGRPDLHRRLAVAEGGSACRQSYIEAVARKLARSGTTDSTARTRDQRETPLRSPLGRVLPLSRHSGRHREPGRVGWQAAICTGLPHGLTS